VKNGDHRDPEAAGWRDVTIGSHWAHARELSPPAFVLCCHPKSPCWGGKFLMWTKGGGRHPWRMWWARKAPSQQSPEASTACFSSPQGAVLHCLLPWAPPAASREPGGHSPVRVQEPWARMSESAIREALREAWPHRPGKSHPRISTNSGLKANFGQWTGFIQPIEVSIWKKKKWLSVFQNQIYYLKLWISGFQKPRRLASPSFCSLLETRAGFTDAAPAGARAQCATPTSRSPVPCHRQLPPMLSVCWRTVACVLLLSGEGKHVYLEGLWLKKG
jgi:hypothetical protein